MINALYIANTGLRSQQTHLDIISNNVVNLNTAGFKKVQVSFADLTYQSAEPAGTKTASAQNAQSIGSGTQITSMRTDFSSGSMRQSNSPLDIAIQGNGFLEVVSETGELMYTRAGRLIVDNEGFLATQTGERLSSNIQVPPDAEGIEFAKNGDVSVKIAGQDDPVLLGTLELARFTNPSALTAAGNGHYLATDAAGQPFIAAPGEAGLGEIGQGYIEMSNVDLAEEMTNLMLAQRAYQLNARLLQASDQVLETINNLRR